MRLRHLYLLLIPAILLVGCGSSQSSNSAVEDGWCKSAPGVLPDSQYCPDSPNYVGDGYFKDKPVTNFDSGSSENSKDVQLLVFLLLFLALYIFLLVMFLKWVAKTARKNKRSVVGFVWLGFLTPYVAWVILLTMDRSDNK
jgi:hypothetical protein